MANLFISFHYLNKLFLGFSSFLGLHFGARGTKNVIRKTGEI